MQHGPYRLKRYYSLREYDQQAFGCRVAKIPLNAGLGCPNRDGSKGVGGCIFCSQAGSGEFAGRPEQPLRQQFEAGRALLARKWPEAAAIAYFQAYTNTYAPLEQLRRLYEEALSFPGVVGLAIATRADCLPQETADYLAQLNRRTHLVVELGLQSAFDETGRRIRRCHSWADFLEGYGRLQQRGIRVCVHLIDGLPGETPEMMVESARRVAALRPHSVKLHLLHLVRGTALEKIYDAGDLRFLSREEYVKIVVDQLEVLPPDTVIARLTGDGPRQSLIGPLWSLHKRQVLNAIDQELARRDSWQAKRWSEDV